MKIALVSHTYPTRDAPAQVPFIKQEAHVVAQNHEVELYLPAVYALPVQKQFYRSLRPDEENLQIHQFSYLSFPGRRLASFTQKSLSKRLLKSIQKQKPDLVHLHWLYPAGLTIPALKRAGYPVILTIHGGDWYSNVSNQKRMIMLETSLQMCDKIICVGKRLIKDISSYNSSLKNRLVHIPHGIDTGCFFPFRNGDSIKNNPTWGRTKTHILCVANLYHGKGVDLLIKAFATLEIRGRCHLHIISPGGDQNTKTKIQTLLETHKIDQQITFYGAQSQNQLADFYRAADLLVSPSRKEGFGLVVAEAIACGTPVLATRSGGPEEIVTPDAGLLVEAGSSEKLAKGMNSMLKKLDTFNAEKMHGYIKSNFSTRAKKEKLMAVYRDTLK